MVCLLLNGMNGIVCVAFSLGNLWTNFGCVRLSRCSMGENTTTGESCFDHAQMLECVWQCGNSPRHFTGRRDITIRIDWIYICPWQVCATCVVFCSFPFLQSLSLSTLFPQVCHWEGHAVAAGECWQHVHQWQVHWVSSWSTTLQECQVRQLLTTALIYIYIPGSVCVHLCGHTGATMDWSTWMLLVFFKMCGRRLRIKD